MTIALRPAVPADAPALVALVRHAYRGRDGWTTEADLLADERIDEATMLVKITRPDAVVLVIDDSDGTPLACCELERRTDDVAYFGLFAVRPAQQGSGVGRQVLAAAEDEARRRWGSTTLEMRVVMPRPDLVAWYQRRGFALTGETWPFPYDELLVNGPALRDDLVFAVLAKPLG